MVVGMMNHTKNLKFFWFLYLLLCIKCIKLGWAGGIPEIQYVCLVVFLDMNNACRPPNDIYFLKAVTMTSYHDPFNSSPIHSTGPKTQKSFASSFCLWRLYFWLEVTNNFKKERRELIQPTDWHYPDCFQHPHCCWVGNRRPQLVSSLSKPPAACFPGSSSCGSTPCASW